MSTVTPTLLFTFADGKSKLYSVSARWITSLEVWEGNRVLDTDHVAALQTAIADPTQIQGPFGVLEYTDDAGTLQRRIIDGQHRQAVLKAHFAANPTAADFPVLTRRYTDVPDHTAAIQIFQQINHAKPMVYKGSPVEHLCAIVTAFRRAFVHTGRTRSAPSVQLVRQGCNRPALSIENLETALKLYGLHERADLTPTAVVTHAQKMNVWFAEDCTRITAPVTHTMLERAMEYNFFLGLDPKCAWLIGLIRKV